MAYTYILKKLIPEVRSSLSDVPTEFLTDIQIRNELEKAEAYCLMICLPTTAESYFVHCITVVAIYYSYINYTSLSERQLGTLPPTSLIRLNALRKVAVSFLQLVSQYPLTDDLTLDMKSYRDTNVAAMTFTPSVIDDD